MVKTRRDAINRIPTVQFISSSILNTFTYGELAICFYKAINFLRN
ncbi:hypothetical protein Fluta_1808 [Fluviicola taffensis DSM 16823]|uniref:Uncharacterized protein n=1 Tax=Fluviicola taffensis (strain DSM 16823 / NCIMB 13979 / RW262) TaxID=755732 RepID=F2II88_FLUTR|nr:hypothetical protein Fluta_1808 [Fluviicola taffensis DSM 16823]